MPVMMTNSGEVGAREDFLRARFEIFRALAGGIAGLHEMDSSIEARRWPRVPDCQVRYHRLYRALARETCRQNRETDSFPDAGR